MRRRGEDGGYAEKSGFGTEHFLEPRLDGGAGIADGLFEAVPDVGGLAVDGKGVEGHGGVGGAGVFDEIQEEVDGAGLAGGADGADEGVATVGVSRFLPGGLEDLFGFGEAGGAKGERGFGSDVEEGGIEESGDEGDGVARFQAEERIEDLTDDGRLLIAGAGFEAEEERGLVAAHFGDGADGFEADGLSALGKAFDKGAEDVFPANVGTGGKGEKANAAEAGSGVFLATPDGLHLDPARAAEEGSGLAVVEIDERLGDGVLAPALGVAIEGLFEEAVEGAQEVGDKLAKLVRGGYFGTLRNDEADAVGEGFAQGGRGGFRGQLAEPLDFLFDTPICHIPDLSG
jgi:hypothetical protein